MRLIMALVLFFASAAPIWAADTCAHDYEELTFENPPQRARMLAAEVRHQHFDLALQKEYDPRSVYLGVANSDRDGAHHYYLVSGKTRFDARPLFNPARLRFYKTDEIPVPKGALFKIDFDAATKERIERAMEKYGTSRNLSCLHGVCRVLNDAGVEIKLPGRKLRARPFLLNLVNGELRENGQDMPKNAIQMFVTSSEELTHFVERSLNADVDAAREFAPYLRQGVVMVGMIAAAGGSVVYYYIEEMK